MKTADLTGRPSHVRWYILALLTSFSLVSYVERINLSVASRFIRDEFGLTDIQLGWSFSAFLVAYTVAQIPSGSLADRHGSRKVLAVAALAWFFITVAMGVYVGWIASSATQVFVSLIALRVMLGVTEAPTFPAGSSAIARWFPSRERGKASAIVQAASYGGEALTLVVLAAVVAASGWRAAIFLSAAPALLLAIAWWRLGRSRPEDHAGVNQAELDLIRADPGPAIADHPGGGIMAVILRRDVSLLSASYFCQGYVIYLFFFWFYIYLVDVRGFSIAAGGIVGALPTVAAAICALAGGWVSDSAAKRWGTLAGRKIVIIASALVGGALLLGGALADQAVIAIACFVGAIGTRGLVESAYWSTIIDLTGRRAGAAGGAMNMMSNLGGAVSTALAPMLVAEFGWPVALSIAASLTALSGLIVLAIPNRSIEAG